MNWITNFVRPRIKGLMAARAAAHATRRKISGANAPACGEMIFHRDLAANLHVCPQCGHHMRIGPAERFAYTFDANRLRRIAAAQTCQPIRCASAARRNMPTR